MIKYDPGIIQEYAEYLYRKANEIIFYCVCFGILIFGVVRHFIADSMHKNSDDLRLITGVSAFAGAIIGYWIGRSKAFILKVRAQRALCQLMIEHNTRSK